MSSGPRKVVVSDGQRKPDSSGPSEMVVPEEIWSTQTGMQKKLYHMFFLLFSMRAGNADPDRVALFFDWAAEMVALFF